MSRLMRVWGTRLFIALAALAAAPALCADLQISGYSWVPDPVPNGAATVFTVRASNNGPGTINDAVVTIGISNRFRVDPGNFPAFCNIAGAIGSQTLTCNLAAFPVGDRTFQYTAMAIAVGSVNTTATISSVSANDPNAANNSLTVTPAVQNGANLATVKDDQLPGHQIPAGGTINYSINVTNSGPDATAAISVTDNLPPASDFLYQSASGANWNCSQAGTMVTCNYTGAAMTGALPPITVTGRVTKATAGTITNNAFATLTSPLVLDPDGANNASPPVVTTIIDGSDLRAGKTMPTTIVQGTTVNIDLTLFNDGPQSEIGATIVDTISANFSIGALPAGCSRNLQTVTCNAGTLAANTSRLFSIPVTALNVTPPNQINTATLGLPPGFNDANTGNNSANATYRIVASTADLSLTKTKTPNPVQAGQNMTSTITVKNNGPAVLNYAPGTPLRVTDTVSPDESYVSNGAGFGCAQVAAVITCATTGSGTIPVNSTLVLTIVTQASVTANSNLVNTACTGTTGTSLALPLDSNAANDCSNATSRATTVTTDLAITKEVSLAAAGPWTQAPALNVPGGNNSFFIRFTAQNLGAADADTVTVTDDLPNNLNTGGFVTGYAQISVTAGNTSFAPASGTVSWTFSNLAAGGSQQAIVRIDRPFNNGNFTNMATISSPDTIDTNAANNSSSALLTIQPLADIAVTDKSISPNPARIGVVSTYTISVRNNGANNASNVALSDTIDPSRFTLVGNPATTKPGGTCTKNDATGLVSCTLGAFARNQSFQVTQSVRPRFPFGGAVSGFPLSHTNTASATTTTTESDATNNSFSLMHQVTAPGFDLAITKNEPGPEFDPLRFGDELVYDVRVSNFGPSLATNVVITDIPQPPPGYTMALAGFSVNPVPANGGLTLYTPPAPNCTTVGANVECRLDAGNPANNTLDALNQVIFRLRFTPGGPAPTGSLTFTDTAQVIALEQDNVTTNQADQQLANNQATQTTTVLPSTDLEVVSKTTVTPSPVQINQPIQYSIVIRNNGVSPTSQVRVTDQLPAGFVLAGPAPTAIAQGSASVSAINCTGTNTVLCILDGSFPENGSLVTITLTARADYPFAGALSADQTNTATIAPGQSGGVDLSRDSNPNNNSKSSVVQVTASSLAGTAYADDNNDNAIQPGELLPNVTVTLTGTDTFGNVLPARMLTTDAAGAFLFDRLPAGTYTLVEMQPAGFADARETAGTAGGTVNNASFGSGAATNSISAITLPATTAATGYIFQELRAASVSGTVYRDTNNNGTLDAGEPGVPAVEFAATPQIRLTGTDYSGAVVNLTTTVDAGGFYSFTGLAPSNAGGYTVTELVQPNNLADGLDTNGVGAVIAGSAGRAAPENIPVGVVAAGAALTNRNFGELATTTLMGSVFLDPNTNATKDPAETTGLAGALVRLTGTNSNNQAIDCSVTTDATGNYAFPLPASGDPLCRTLLPGTYTLTETPPPGFTPTGAFIGSLGGTAGGQSGANTASPGNITTTTNIIVGASAMGTRYDFGATGQGLSGFVYVDRNGNGVRDAGEPGIATVGVSLSGSTSNGQDVCTVTTCTATTDAAGNFFFNGVPGSNGAGYTLTEQPQGNAPLNAYADGQDAAGSAGGVAGNDVIGAIVLATGANGTNYAFGERAGSLAGNVYIDANDDGVRQAGESAIPGVVVTLSGTTINGANICTLRAALSPALGCTATSAADGSYRFDDLPAGNYTLTESQPSQYSDGRESAGSPAGTIDNGSFGSAAAQNRVSAIALGNGVAGAGYDFGERATSIAGRVYLDPERDGADNGEPGIAGVTIVLRQNNVVVATTVTGPDGRYRFDGLPVGSYTVEEQQPAGYGSSTPDSRAVSVTVGQTANVDFGDTNSTLAGSVYLDLNNDGVRQAGEAGIAGVTVTLSGTTAGGQQISFTQTTDATGAYRFTGLLGGSYTVTETQPPGVGDGKDTAGSSGGTVGNDVISAIALVGGVDATGYTFGEQGQGLTGTVYIDTNLDGARGQSEPGISGVIIELQWPDGSVVATTTTAADGSYSFPGLAAGDYVIVERQPAGYGDAAENATNRVPLTVVAGRPIPATNFGERTGSIAGVVYNDSNNNGVRDPGEPPIAGVTITLSGMDARGNPVTGTATSGADGSYLFTGLPGGNYTLTETQPANYADGLDRAGTAGGTATNPGDAIAGIALAPAQAAGGYLFGERGAAARISGHVWMDADHDRVFDPGEVPQVGWIVELLQGGIVVQTITTGADGGYQFTNVPPGSGYTIRFRNPESNALFGSARPNETGQPVTEGVVSAGNPAGARTSDGVLSGLTIPPGADIQQQSLPLDPSGVVYDSIKRTPVPGATVRITGPAGFDPATQLLGGAANASQTVGTNGVYQFLLLAGAPAGTYSLIVTPPAGGGYNPVPSALIAPCAGALTVGAVPDPLLVSTYDTAPPTNAPASCTPNGATTAYFFAFVLTPGVSANVVNNHIPLDPILSGAIIVTKTTPLTNVTRGGLVPYTVTARNALAGVLNNVTITDRLPAGFAYRAGSATIDGIPAIPAQTGRILNFPGQRFTAGQEKVLKLILVVGAGVGEGEHVNQAFAVNPAVGGTISNIAEATVRLLPDPDFDCTDVLGKVWDDANMNGTQDSGERGLPGVRLATVNGLLITTDAEGRYHITCPMIPNEDRGSNFIAKVDVRTLPTGYRMTTSNPETVRMTRGKFVILNFGAALGRVVRLDLNGTAFDRDVLKPAFDAKLDALVATLAEKPSVLRIGYAVHGEESTQVRHRLDAVRDAVERRWGAVKDRYRLIVETETGIASGPGGGR